MALVDVAFVQLVCLVAVACRFDAHGEVVIARQHSAEPAREAKLPHRHAGGDAGAAVVAVGAVEVVAGAAKAHPTQRGIGASRVVFRRVEKQRAGIALEIAARMLRRQQEAALHDVAKAQGPAVGGMLVVAANAVKEFLAWHERRAERLQMLVHDLTVEQLEPSHHEMLRKPREPRLGGVAAGTEHGFGEEHAAEGDAVHAADKLALLPDFHGMREPHLVQLRIGALHGWRDPSAAAIAARRGATCDDGVEVTIGRDLEVPSTKAPAHSARNMQPACARPLPRLAVRISQGHDHARIRRPPQDRFRVAVEPGKDALRIGVDQALGRQVAADSHQPRSRRHDSERNFSASRAAMQPNPAEVMACR